MADRVTLWRFRYEDGGSDYWRTGTPAAEKYNVEVRTALLLPEGATVPNPSHPNNQVGGVEAELLARAQQRVRGESGSTQFQCDVARRDAFREAAQLLRDSVQPRVCETCGDDWHYPIAGPLRPGTCPDDFHDPVPVEQGEGGTNPPDANPALGPDADPGGSVPPSIQPEQEQTRALREALQGMAEEAAERAEWEEDQATKLKPTSAGKHFARAQVHRGYRDRIRAALAAALEGGG